VIAYAVCWVAITEERPETGRLVLGGSLVVLAGVLFLLDALDVWRLPVDYLVPLALIMLGLVVLASAWPLRSRRS
jgi:hypothetical protein